MMARGVSKTKVYEAIKQRWLNLNPGKADRFCEGSPYYLKELNEILSNPCMTACSVPTKRVRDANLTRICKPFTPLRQ